MRSVTVHRKPVLCVSADTVHKRVELKPNSLSPRNTIGEKDLAEYQHTAMLVKQTPWNLHRASIYLSKWTDNNKGGEVVPGASGKKKKDVIVNVPIPEPVFLLRGPGHHPARQEAVEVDGADVAPVTLDAIRVRQGKAVPVAPLTDGDGAVAHDALPLPLPAEDPLPAPDRPEAAGPYAMPLEVPADVDLTVGCAKCRQKGCRRCKWLRAKLCAEAMGLPIPEPPKKLKVMKRPAAAIG